MTTKTYPTMPWLSAEEAEERSRELGKLFRQTVNRAGELLALKVTDPDVARFLLYELLETQQYIEAGNSTIAEDLLRRMTEKLNRR